MAVYEKKPYPFHRVCGEYVSNEVVPFLKMEDLFPSKFEPSAITRFTLTAHDGREASMPLDLGAFGISRYVFDNFLYECAERAGVRFHFEEVISCVFDGKTFRFKTAQGEKTTDVVIGAFGKRSRLDAVLQRKFFKKRSPYMGVKYHLRSNHPADLIALHNFNGGYCGVNNVEHGITNMCYLTHRESVRKAGSLDAFEKSILFKNPHLRKLRAESESLFEKPEVINEISFEKKEPVYNHMLMAGDAAGMIAPLCGNGMAMAIHAGKIAADLVDLFCKGKIDRVELESRYTKEWNALFAQRLWRGRQIQKLFGNNLLSQFSVSLTLHVPPLARALMSKTHGEPF